MRKILLLLGVGVGYVLGARAGREKYDKIADTASKAWGDPRVQDKVEQAKENLPEVAHKAADTAKTAAAKAKSKVTGHETTSLGGNYSNDTGSISGDGEVDVDASGFGPGSDKLP